MGRCRILKEKFPDDRLEVYEPYRKLFFETMFERQLIWYKRFILKKPRPWTDNEILRDYKFTNVYRELDRNSQWLIKNIIMDSKLTDKELVWKMMFFRLFNNPETFTFEAKDKVLQKKFFDDRFNSVDDLISSSRWRNGIPDYDEYDVEEFSRFIEGVRRVGQNPFTNAYLVNSGVVKGQSRDEYYTKMVIPELHGKMDEVIDIICCANRPEDIIRYFNSLRAVSDFMSHEFYQDLTYISIYTDRKIMRFDQNDFTNVGHGASVGIRLIFPNLKGVDQKSGIYRLRDEANEMLAKISKEKGVDSFPFVSWNKKKSCYSVKNDCNITLHQIEMWLCEFQKYWKMMIGDGKQRSLFTPKTK